MASPAVTFTFVNSTTADGTQVNQNFTDLINGVTDGTKDLSISALTAAGTSTLNGSVVLGNSSLKDLTVNASLASSIPIKTDNTYSIGAAGVGLAGLFLGNSSKTVKLAAPAGMSASYTLTLPVSGGTADYLTATDGSGALSFVPAPKNFDHAINYSLAASVATSVLTVTLNAADGTTPSSTNKVSVNFRNATLATGTPVTRTVSSALSMTVNASASLGLTASQNQYVWVYAIDATSAGGSGIELAVAGNRVFDEGVLYTTTAVTAGATDGLTLYSTSGRASVPVRLLGRLKVNTATFWATAPTGIDNFTVPTLPRSEVRVVTGNGHGSTNTTIRRFTTTELNTGTAITYADSSTNGASFTINEDGIYQIDYSDYRAANIATIGATKNTTQGTVSIASTTITSSSRVGLGTAPSAGTAGSFSWTGKLVTGDVVRPHTTSTADSTDNLSYFHITKVSN